MVQMVVELAVEQLVVEQVVEVHSLFVQMELLNI